jgi:hypothetical protein
VDTSTNTGESSSSQQPATSRPRISNTALVTVLPPLQPDISELTARNYLPSIKSITNPDVEMKPETLVALRTLLKDSDATFKSVYQAKAVQLFLNRETDLLIILPTGGGKSVTFEIAPILEPITGHSCGDLSVRRALVLFCVQKSGPFGPHSGEGPPTAERVKTEGSGP